MNVSLSPELVERLDAHVESGKFKSRDEALHAAVALFLSDPEEYQRKVKEFHALIAEGEAAYARGEYTEISSDKELDEFFDSL